MLIPSKHFFKQVMATKWAIFCPGCLTFKMQDRATRHFGTCGEENYIRRFNTRELGALNSIIRSRKEPLLIKYIDYFNKRFINL